MITVLCKPQITVNILATQRLRGGIGENPGGVGFMTFIGQHGSVDHAGEPS